MQYFRWTIFILVMAFFALSSYAMAFGDDPRGVEVLPWNLAAWAAFGFLAFRWPWNHRKA